MRGRQGRANSGVNIVCELLMKTLIAAVLSVCALLIAGVEWTSPADEFDMRFVLTASSGQAPNWTRQTRHFIICGRLRRRRRRSRYSYRQTTCWWWRYWRRSVQYGQISSHGRRCNFLGWGQVYLYVGVALGHWRDPRPPEGGGLSVS